MTWWEDDSLEIAIFATEIGSISICQHVLVGPYFLQVLNLNDFARLGPSFWEMTWWSYIKAVFGDHDSYRRGKNMIMMKMIIIANLLYVRWSRCARWSRCRVCGSTMATPSCSLENSSAFIKRFQIRCVFYSFWCIFW